MRLALTIGLAAALLALAGCSAGTVQNTATTSSTSATATSAPVRTHEVTYAFYVAGANGSVDAPFTYVADGGSMVTERTNGFGFFKTVHLPEGKIAMIALGSVDGIAYSSCSLSQDGRTVAEQKSQDPKAPASCSYIVH